MQLEQPGAGQHRPILSPCALWSVDLKLTHLDWNPEATLIHFLGQYLSICELDYSILQREIQNTPKLKSTVDVGDLCLVEDPTSDDWHRGRIHSKKEDLCDVFLIDCGDILSVSVANIYTCSNDLFTLPPKVVCGFLANVLPLERCLISVLEKYFSSLIGRKVTGYIHALLPHKVVLLEIPEINNDLVRQGFGRHVDTDTFLLLVEMVTDRQLKQNIEPVPDLLIEKPKRQELCLKVSGLHGYDDILTSYGPKLSDGTRAKVRVTAAVNPGLFYCQMASMEKELWEMSSKLATVCGDVPTGSSQKTSENLGSLCAVKGKDDKWYRGFVQFLPVNSQVRVLFIDYGFFELVRVENIHRLPLDFDSVPIMAFPCCLFSLNNESGQAQAEQLTFLKKGLLGNVLDVEIRGTVSKQNAHLITIIGSDENYVESVEAVQVRPQTKVESEQLQSPGGYLYRQTAVRKRLFKTLKAEELQEGSLFVGYVAGAQNPHQFWMRSQKRNTAFEQMMAGIEVYYRYKELDEDVLMDPEVGTLCCAVYEKDMHFYRGVVTDILKHGVEVFFIDFGNTEKVPYKLIKKMPKAFASQPGFAFSCSLVNVLPLDEVWTVAACDFFRRAVSNKALLVHVLQLKKNKVFVDLREMERDIHQSITAVLIAAEQAEHWNNFPLQTVMESTDVIGGEKSSDKGARQSKNQSEKAHESCCFKELSIKSGSELKVHCYFVNSPSDFWCQAVDEKNALKELMDKVQLYYSHHRVVLHPGQLCCVAKLPCNGIWYRALITKRQRSHVKVILIDYGCGAQIKQSHIQGILPEFLDLERQAFRCSLDSQIEPAKPGDWSAAACSLLQNFVRDTACLLRCKVSSQSKVESKGFYNVVDLHSGQTRHSIKKILLEQGLARGVILKQLSPGFPDAFVLGQFNVDPGQEEQIFVTHVNSHLDFYCQLDRNTDVIEELEKKIAVESEKMKIASSEGACGKLCLAKYFDGNWYRAVASPVHFSPLHLSVFFVDYGNTCITEKEHIMIIPGDCADLLEIPMQALRCSLASVTSGVGHPDVKEYLKETVLNRQIRAHIAGKNRAGSFDVELFDGELNINQKVNELLARLVPYSKPAGRVDTSHTERKQEVHSRGTVGTSVKNHSQSKCHAPLPTAQRGTCADGTKIGSYVDATNNELCENNNKSLVQGRTQSEETNVSLQKGPLTKSCDTKLKLKSEQLSFATADTSTVSCLSSKKVTKGLTAVCFVSHIDSSKSFFLQLDDDEPDILKMVEGLNSNSLKESLKKVTTVQVSDLVLAEFEEDGALYRAAVKDSAGSSHFIVEFVDYGNSSAVEKEKMYCMPTEYLSQPRFGIPCSLVHPSLYQSEASFADAVSEKPLVVEFVCQLETHWEVKIKSLDVTDGHGVPPETTLEVVTQHENMERECADVSKTEGTVSVCEKDDLQHQESKNSILTDEGVPRVEKILNEQLSVSQTYPPAGSMAPLHTEVQDGTEAEGQPKHLRFASFHLNQEYSGSATAVKTPSEFYVLLEDSGDATRRGASRLSKSDATETLGRAETMHLDTAAMLPPGGYFHDKHAPCTTPNRLPPESRNRTQSVHRCSLRGVMPVTPDFKWSVAAESHFQRCLSQKDLQIFLREFMSDESWMVDVLVDGVHVAKELVGAGHASYTDVLLQLRFQEQSAKTVECHEAGTQADWGLEEAPSAGSDHLAESSADED